MNVFTFSGRLGRDAEFRHLQSGETVLNFSVANETGFGDRKQTQWIDCALWGKRGERLADYMRKGTQVVVSGEVTLREFDRQGTTTRGAVLSVRVNDVTLVGGRRDGDDRGDSRSSFGGRGDGGPPAGGGYGGGSSRTRPGSDLDDDIPFAPEIR